jgi:hypothetical protein
VYAAADGTLQATVDPAVQENRAAGAPAGSYLVQAEAGPVQALASFTISAGPGSSGPGSSDAASSGPSASPSPSS